MKAVEVVTTKEAYFLSLVGLIPDQFREDMIPLLQARFSNEIKKFKVDAQPQTKLIE